jgi:hypothetical protein
MKNLLFSLVSFVAFSFGAIAQNVSIPEPSFKAALLANTAINTDADKLEIPKVEAVAFSGTIDVSGKNITSLVRIVLSCCI